MKNTLHFLLVTYVALFIHLQAYGKENHGLPSGNYQVGIDLAEFDTATTLKIENPFGKIMYRVVDGITDIQFSGMNVHENPAEVVTLLENSVLTLKIKSPPLFHSGIALKHLGREVLDYDGLMELIPRYPTIIKHDASENRITVAGLFSSRPGTFTARGASFVVGRVKDFRMDVTVLIPSGRFDNARLNSEGTCESEFP